MRPGRGGANVSGMSWRPLSLVLLGCGCAGAGAVPPPAPAALDAAVTTDAAAAGADRAIPDGATTIAADATTILADATTAAGDALAPRRPDPRYLPSATGPCPEITDGMATFQPAAGARQVRLWVSDAA